MDRLKTLFGEPAAVIGTVTAVIAFALTLSGLDTNTQGIVMAFVVALGGVWGAWATQTTLLGALVGVVNTGAVLLATLHYSLSETSQAALISVITVALGLFYRTQTSPVVEPKRSLNVDVGSTGEWGGSHVNQP
jgi:hypothetical protein